MSNRPDSYSYSACGKAILLGEHFVVYGVPAVAVPLTGVRTTVTATPLLSPQSSCWVDPTLSPAESELAAQLLRHARLRLGSTLPLSVRAHSTIPRGCGLGSSASLAAALCGALARAEDRSLTSEELRAHAHALEELVHGAPSGIDDATVAWATPLSFRKGDAPEPLHSPIDLTLVLASSGPAATTREAVARVAETRLADPDGFASLCQAAAQQVSLGTAALGRGDLANLGRAMNEMQRLLGLVGVSTPALESLVQTALSAGAWGAKLTGAGLGGFMLALVDTDQVDRVSRALRVDGAEHILVTVVPATAMVVAQREGTAA